jgi:hypothetical protein
MRPRAKGTQLLLKEKGRGLLSRLTWSPIVDRVVQLRNERSLRQLKKLLEPAE